MVGSVISHNSLTATIPFHAPPPPAPQEECGYFHAMQL